MTRKSKKLAGSLLLGIYLIAYVAVVSGLGARITEISDWLQIVFYIVAGIAWIIPLKPVFAWMNRS